MAQYCLLPSELFFSPPIPKKLQGYIFNKVGLIAETIIGIKYNGFTGRTSWYPSPPQADDFRDGSQGLSSKTIYHMFLVDKNPGVDQNKLNELINVRVPRLEDDGQILYIPDLMSEKAPASKRFYEVKPGRPNETNLKGEEKIASVDGFMAEASLPYELGDAWKPLGSHLIGFGLFPNPIPVVPPIPFKATFEYCRHSTVRGLVVYRFCATFPEISLVPVAIIAAALALVILAAWLAEKLKDLPGLPNPAHWQTEARSVRAFGAVPRTSTPSPMAQHLRDLLARVPQWPTASAAQRIAIRGSIGRSAQNHREDVRLAQFLLNIWNGLSNQNVLAVDGMSGPLTCACITAFQQAMGLRVADGRIDPGGPTLGILGKIALLWLASGVRSISLDYPRSGQPSVPIAGIDPLTTMWAAMAGSRTPR